MIFLAILTSLLAIVAVWLSWRLKHRSGWIMALGLVIVSGYLFSRDMGWEQGIFIALFLPGLLIWAVVVKERTFKPYSKKSVPPRALSPSWKKGIFHLFTGITLLVVQLALSLVVAVALSRLIPVAEAGQLALCVVFQPVIWALMMYQYLARKDRLIILGWHGLLAALASIIVMV